MNEKIQLLDYKCTITHILTRLANPPWQPEDQLLVNVEFEEPHPASILSTYIAIPVKDYSKGELLKVVKEHGDEQLADAITKHIKEAEKDAAASQRKAELQAVAKSIESKFE